MGKKFVIFGRDTVTHLKTVPLLLPGDGGNRFTAETAWTKHAVCFLLF